MPKRFNITCYNKLYNLTKLEVSYMYFSNTDSESYSKDD